MINLLLLSHSYKLVEGLRDILSQIVQNVNIEISGGTFDGELGSNFEEIMEKIDRLSKSGGVVVIFDMGSSMMNAQTAYEMLSEENRINVILADGPMIESSVQIAIMAESGQELSEIENYVEECSLKKFD